MKKFLCAVILSAAAVFCSGHVGVDYARQNSIHVVRPDETVYDISWQYMSHQDKHDYVLSLIHDIREANNITDPRLIQPGQKLIIPLYVKK